MGKIKRGARHVVHRVLSPHLQEQTAAIAALISDRSPDIDPVLRDFNHLLHELRTIALRDLPAIGRTLLSAGCAGGWYFDWVEQAAGPIAEHIGVELYSPKPEGLPGNVRWITASASAMPHVADAGVDVVFSGQNFEHLWIDDMVGFLLESWRVLRPGGALVVDSPNRLVADAIGWVQPEHTLELSPAEAGALLEIAGFDVISARGLWRCRERSGEYMALIPPVNDVRHVLDRAVGVIDVDDAFVWWITAHRTDRAPDEARLRATVATLFETHWDRRINRGAHFVDGDLARWTTWGFPVFAGSVEVEVASELPVRLRRADGTEIATGVGSVSASVDETLFGVSAEVTLADLGVAPTADLFRVRLSPALSATARGL